MSLVVNAGLFIYYRYTLVLGTLSYKDVNKEPILVNQDNEHNSGKQDTAQEMPCSRNRGTRISN